MTNTSDPAQSLYRFCN